jgi:hypothetical protein
VGMGFDVSHSRMMVDAPAGVKTEIKTSGRPPSARICGPARVPGKRLNEVAGGRKVPVPSGRAIF